jgi:hypothetical protein
VGKRNSHACWWECKLVELLCKTVWRILKKLKIELPYDPVTPLLSIHLKECAPGYNRGSCIPMFIAAVFTMAKFCKQTRCSTDVCVCVCIYNGVLLNHKKEWNYVVCREMDGTGEHQVKQNKPNLKGQRSHVCPHMWKPDLYTWIHVWSYIHACIHINA